MHVAARPPLAERLPPLSDAVVLCIVGGLSIGLHALAIGLGVHVTSLQLQTGTLARNNWQLLPASLLRHDLVASLAHLHSQPPLYNVATAFLLQLPHVTQPAAASAGMLVCGAAVAIGTAGALLELGVRRGVVLAVVIVFVVADPAQYLYAAYYFYALPTAALVTCMGWAAIRWARTERALPGACFGAVAALVVLTNSSYQLYTVALASVPVLWVLRRRWRQVLTVLILPLVVVLAWYANDVAQFGTATTSSWIGMNLARATLALDSPADIQALVRQGVLNQTALVPPFSGLGGYGASGLHAATGHAALDQRFSFVDPRNSQLDVPNFDNIAYVGISQRYLADDLTWIAHRPLQYLKNTTVGLRLWLLPTQQWFGTVGLPRYHLGGYTTVYDLVVNLQPDADPGAVSAVIFARRGPSLSNLSYTAVLESVLALLVLPIAAWRRRRRDPKRSAGAGFVWVLCASVFVTTTLLEAAENNRFRFELGGLPIVGATAALALLLDRSLLGGELLGGTGGEGDGGAGEALAVDDEPPRVAARGDELEGAEVDRHGHVDG